MRSLSEAMCVADVADEGEGEVEEEEEEEEWVSFNWAIVAAPMALARA